MEDSSTCRIENCRRPVYIKKWQLCDSHYGTASKRGEIPARPSTVHVLSNVDLETKRGDCALCGADVPLRTRVRKSGKLYVTCQRGQSGPGRRRERARSGVASSNQRWRLYGVSDAEYQLRYAAQQGCCLICDEPLVKPVVDHEHGSGHVRGILCTYCNTGLGMFRDNPAALAKAAKYVRRYLKAAS